MTRVEPEPEKTPHPASVARFARKGPRWANRRYAVASVSVWAVSGVSVATGLAATHHGGGVRWIVFAVFAVLAGVIELLNARALRRQRTERWERRREAGGAHELRNRDV
jgi:hypothetical protein